MKYIIDTNSPFIMAEYELENVSVFIDESIISKIDFLSLLYNNEAEPCHAQNVYDDLIIELSNK
ncbi:MAG: hypothetical protein IJG23_07100 [Clostridia bacterium]|nr:hypothetical protein [Clostridia bacterium]